MFPKLSTPMDVATEMSKRSCLRQPFGSQRVNSYQTLLKSSRHHFYTPVPLICDKSSGKKLFLVTSEMLGLFVNTWTSDDKCSNLNAIISKTKIFFLIFHQISEF